MRFSRYPIRIPLGIMLVIGGEGRMRDRDISELMQSGNDFREGSLSHRVSMGL